MRKKILIPTIIGFMMLFVSVASAQMIPDVVIRTDKPKYLPGEKGTIHVTFYNNRDNPISIHNMTVIYSYWQAYIDDKWVGNKTIEVDVTIAEYGIEQLEAVDFVVPSDGRAVSTPVTVVIGTSDWFYQGMGQIIVVETLYYMEQIVTLFTILVVLVIVCTIIVAATIFLSARRPQAMWREPQKAE